MTGEDFLENLRTDSVESIFWPARALTRSSVWPPGIDVDVSHLHVGSTSLVISGGADVSDSQASHAFTLTSASLSFSQNHISTFEPTSAHT